MDLGRIRDACDLRDQAVARAEGKVVVQIFVAIDVDLRGELAVAGRRHKKVDVSRPLAMPAQLAEQLVGVAAGWAAIT